MADFATLAELKAAVNVSDSSLDTLLTTTNAAATQALIDFMSRDPRADDFVERANGRGRPELLVSQYPINSVASIAITDCGTPVTITPDQFDFDENLIWLKGCQRFPRGRRNVTVTYNAGLDTSQLKSVKLAAIYTARAILTARNVDLNATGESWPAVSTQMWNPGGPGVVPIAAQTLLQNYVRRISV